jgi:tetratricopeptide (TPR) repeat protein
VRLLTHGLIVISLVGISSCVAPTPLSVPTPAVASAPTPAPVSAADFTTAIATFERTASQSPALLNARLDYADFLLDGATGTCGQRLPEARSQLDRVTGSRSAQVLFPDGWSRAAELEYRILLAEASCGGDPTRREHALQAAVTVARRAVSLYHDELDYSSMAVMQFNLSVTEHVLGQNAAAVTALNSAIDMAREYGLRDDAYADYQQLLEWQHNATGAQHVAALMQDFPSRSTTLKFNWSPSDATVAVELNHVRDRNGEISRARGTRTVQRQVRPDHDGWMISYPRASADFATGVWPTGDSDSLAPNSAFRPQLLSFPDITISSAGELKKIINAGAFARRVTAETTAQIRQGAPHGVQAQHLMKIAISSMQVAFSPKAIETETGADYNLQTAIWIDATLQQGVPYEITAALPLPGFSLTVLNQRLQFLYTHPVPCTRDSTEPACAEIVVHLAPETDSLAAKLDALEYQNRQVHYSGAATLRIVTDPKTLTPYVFDARRYWYLSVGADDQDELPGTGELIESEHTLRTVTY